MHPVVDDHNTTSSCVEKQWKNEFSNTESQTVKETLGLYDCKMEDSEISRENSNMHHAYELFPTCKAVLCML